ncbi:MAG: hypothetical protein JXA81_00590 [Sedimentisphaerales bacterium]|nr:hypothetical protein [Sedimentisphaerales bacterium]
MKRSIGNFLIILSILCVAATIVWFGSGLADMPENLNEDDRTMLIAMSLFAIVLLALECTIFLYGRYLRRRYPAEVQKQKKSLRKRCLLPLAVSLGCSIAITIFIFFPKKGMFEIKALGFVIGQPSVLAQLIFGGLMGIKLGGDVTKHAVTITFNLMYYLILFYPGFRIVTMDRNAEVTSYRLMKTLLIIFVGIHILMGFVMAMLVRA